MEEQKSTQTIDAIELARNVQRLIGEATRHRKFISLEERLNWFVERRGQLVAYQNILNLIKEETK